MKPKRRGPASMSQATQATHRRSRGFANERAAIVEFTALTAALVAMLAVVFHFLVVGHVRHVVELHVDAGVLDTAAFDGSEIDGIERVNTGLGNATGWLETYAVSAIRTPATSTVRVEAEALEVLPWLNATVVVERTLTTESTSP